MRSPSLRAFAWLGLITLGVAAVSCTPHRGPRTAPEAGLVALAGVHVLPMTHDTVLRDHTVLIRGNRIIAVGEAGRVRIPAGARLIEGEQRYLLPGFWDMHVHAVNAVGADAEPEHAFALLLANGVTGVRDMGSHLDTLLAVRRRLTETAYRAPRLFAAGPLLDGPRQAWSIPYARHLETAEQARRVLDDLEAAGVDFLKVYGGLSRDVYLAIAQHAVQIGMPFAGHVPFAVSATVASDAGQASIEHAFLDLFAECVEDGASRIFAILGAWGADGFGAFHAGANAFLDARDEACTTELLARLARNRTAIVPTIVNTIRDRRVLDRAAVRHLGGASAEACRSTVRMIEASPADVRAAYYERFLGDVRRMHAAGVPILAGTDFGNACIGAGFSLHDELEHLVDAGFSAFDALRAATILPARFLGVADSLGVVAPGMLADLVLLDADPSADIRRTRQIAGVMIDGEWYDAAALAVFVERATARPPPGRLR
jgi:imidazolonepropionase-like amidohydrolase